jgi:hypothetical protein
MNVSGQLRASLGSPPGKEPSTGALIGLKSGLDNAQKRKFLAIPGLEQSPSWFSPKPINIWTAISICIRIPIFPHSVLVGDRQILRAGKGITHV